MYKFDATEDIKMLKACQLIAQRQIREKQPLIRTHTIEEVNSQILKCHSNKLDVLWEVFLEEYRRQVGNIDGQIKKIIDLRYTSNWKKSTFFSDIDMEKLYLIMNQDKGQSLTDIVTKFLS